MSYQGSLFIISAASGTGKTSLATALANSLNDIAISVSHTTRQIRPGEQKDSSYFFVDNNTFENMINNGEFLEYAKVFGNYYGTSKKSVLEHLKDGKDVILDIDWQGAHKVKEIMSESAFTIFLLPPSRETLRNRLETRNSDDSKTVAERLTKANDEISHYTEFDYLIINDDFNKALSDLTNIVLATRLKCIRQKKLHERLLEDLLQK